MGFKDYLRVTAMALSNAAREFDQGLAAGDPDYAAARDAVARKASAAAQSVKAKLKEAGETETGQRVGERTRKVGSAIAKAPVLSAVGDTLNEHAGIPELLRLRSERPQDPWRLVWLSEGLQRLNRNRSVFLAVRAPFEPLSAMVALTARTAGSMGVDDPVTQCQLAAWTLAIRSLDDDPSDLTSLHVLARVYLARGFPQSAMSLAAMAALATTDGDLALVTLGIASNQLGIADQAVAAAEHVIEQGCSLGYQLLAEYALDDKQYARSLELLQLVKTADRARYFGVDPSASSIARGAMAAQSAKTRALTNTASTFITPENVHV